jgi:hypothetical protein
LIFADEVAGVAAAFNGLRTIMGSMRPNTVVSAAVFPVSRAALVQDEHRPGGFADDEIALPIATRRFFGGRL